MRSEPLLLSVRTYSYLKFFPREDVLYCYYFLNIFGLQLFLVNVDGSISNDFHSILQILVVRMIWPGVLE